MAVHYRRIFNRVDEAIHNSVLDLRLMLRRAPALRYTVITTWGVSELVTATIFFSRPHLCAHIWSGISFFRKT